MVAIVARTGIWLVLLHSLLISLVTMEIATPAMALSTKDLGPGCRKEYLAWRKRGGYGAFSAASDGSCSWAWDSMTLAQARTSALTGCRKIAKKAAKSCQVIADNDIPSKYVVLSTDCRDATGQKKISACQFLIDNGNGKGNDLAWSYNELGRAYQLNGRQEDAIRAYSMAIKASPSYPWAFINRARIETDLQTKLADAQQYLKHYREDGDDGRAEAQAIIDESKRRLAQLASMNVEGLCRVSLANDKLGWDTSIQYRFETEQAKKRHLTVGLCRVALGMMSEFNAIETSGTEAVCRAALVDDGSSWNASDIARPARAEVWRRSLSLQECRKLVFKVDGTPASSDESEDQFARDYWESIRTTADVSVLLSFIEKYPYGHFSDLGHIKLRELLDREDGLWRQAEGSRSRSLFEQYLGSFPSGRYSTEAREQLASLDKKSPDVMNDAADIERPSANDGSKAQKTVSTPASNKKLKQSETRKSAPTGGKAMTADQRKKYYDEAVNVCRKKYSYHMIRRVEVNWTTLHITCYY